MLKNIKKLKVIIYRFTNLFVYLFPNISYKYWTRLRNENIDSYDEKLCYCGHTNKCSCANPTKQMFLDSIKNDTIKLFDKQNGWKRVE